MEDAFDPVFAAQVTKLLVLGDMHGNLFAWERSVLPAIRQNAPDVIVQVGDFGYGWNDAYLGALDEILEDVRAPMLWLDGNHENFDKMEHVGIFPDKLEPQRTSEHTWYLPRGFTWTWNERRFMAFGGAYSVDKPHRTPHRSWWPQEEATEADVARAVAHGEVDVLLAHDTFSGFLVPGIHAEWKQDEFFWQCKPNRDRMADVLWSAQPQLYVHGHYHHGYDEVWGNGRVGTHIIGLDREDQPRSKAVLNLPLLTWDWA